MQVTKINEKTNKSIYPSAIALGECMCSVHGKIHHQNKAIVAPGDASDGLYVSMDKCGLHSKMRREYSC